MDEHTSTTPQNEPSRNDALNWPFEAEVFDVTAEIKRCADEALRSTDQQARDHLLGRIEGMADVLQSDVPKRLASTTREPGTSSADTNMFGEMSLGAAVLLAHHLAKTVAFLPGPTSPEREALWQISDRLHRDPPEYMVADSLACDAFNRGRRPGQEESRIEMWLLGLVYDALKTGITSAHRLPESEQEPAPSANEIFAQARAIDGLPRATDNWLWPRRAARLKGFGALKTGITPLNRLPESGQEPGPFASGIDLSADAIDGLVEGFKTFLNARKRMAVQCEQECIPVSEDTLVQPESFAWDQLERLMDSLRDLLQHMASATADRSIDAVAAYGIFQMLEVYLNVHKPELMGRTGPQAGEQPAG